jgi:hypothetical protein
MTIIETEATGRINNQMENDEIKEELEELAVKLDVNPEVGLGALEHVSVTECVEILAEKSEKDVILSSIVDYRTQDKLCGQRIGYEVLEVATE